MAASEGSGRLHESALVGWRGRVSEAVAGPVSRRSPLSAEQVRMGLAAAFFASSVLYVAATVGRAVRSRSR